MYSSRNSILLLGITVSILLFWCTVQPANAETSEEEHPLVTDTEEESMDSDEVGVYADLSRRASLRPVVLHQRASLRPYAGKRASLRPFAGRRASLRPFAGKRASLRPASYMGKRKRRSVMNFDE